MAVGQSECQSRCVTRQFGWEALCRGETGLVSVSGSQLHSKCEKPIQASLPLVTRLVEQAFAIPDLVAVHKAYSFLHT